MQFFQVGELSEKLDVSLERHECRRAVGRFVGPLVDGTHITQARLHWPTGSIWMKVGSGSVTLGEACRYATRTANRDFSKAQQSSVTHMPDPSNVTVRCSAAECRGAIKNKLRSLSKAEL